MRVSLLVVLLCLVVPLWSSAVDLAPGEETVVRCVAPTPIPTPIPTPSPSPVPPTPPPTPVPTPVPTPCDRTVESGQNIQSAINASSVGQTVCVKAGTWVLNGTLQMKRGVNVVAYPGMEAYDWSTNTINPNHPKIVPGTCPQCSIRWNIGQGENEFLGFEVTGGWDGLRIHADNVTVRNNWIHHVWYTGILIASASNVLVEQNKSEVVGLNCTGWSNPEDGSNISPRHCHPTYISNVKGYCGVKNITIRENYLANAVGVGVNFNGNDCQNSGGALIEDVLVEGNEIVNVVTGTSQWHGTRNVTVRNNSFTLNDSYDPKNYGGVGTPNIVWSLQCGIVTWDSWPAMSGNTFNLASGWREVCKY